MDIKLSLENLADNIRAVVTTPSRNPWIYEEGEVRKPGSIHIAIFALLIGIGAVTGSFGSIAFPLGYGVSGFWPGVAVQAVGSIWFGLWGALAGGLFPFISNSLSGAPLYVSLAYFPSNFIQGLLPFLVFKYLKVDPRLNNWVGYAAYVLFAVIINNALGATWAVTALTSFHLITVTSTPLFFSGWLIGNGLPSLIFGIIVLKILSKTVVRSRAFCKGWLA
ncbi:MAG: hypothetical protein JRN32_01320 [Nitrososphaerota archaeon]|jgi:hypothetical protein|nr:hypothetical protein [Nitrososphaerota archaeon]MDG7037922.1 hypothetical protein [Nitrososphaerota archaeon]MDG7042644.1 hypothetical protein [Nitrososphaerota archaeon]MDG7045440.1 hypothetical protein [Nitrososphaerota archaeon]MDG7046975.1 hypothetical protein [Nitrososphaerota archaeon]